MSHNLPGYGDPATWPPYSGHPNDPRSDGREEAREAAIDDQVDTLMAEGLEDEAVFEAVIYGTGADVLAELVARHLRRTSSPLRKAVAVDPGLRQAAEKALEEARAQDAIDEAMWRVKR